MRRPITPSLFAPRSLAASPRPRANSQLITRNSQLITRNSQLPRAFTLVELLVVIGIILVLLAIVVVGLRHVSNVAARHETEAELKLCMDMLKEYENVNGLKNIEGPASSVVPGAPYIRLPQPPWLNRFFTPPLFIDSPATQSFALGQQPSSALGLPNFIGGLPNGQAGTPGAAGDMGDKSQAYMPRWTSDAVSWTQCLMFVILKDPKNRATISNLPPNRILETWPPFTAGDQPQPPFTIDAAVVLDGWSNPIVFVPRGGIHVMLNPDNASTGPLEYCIRTSGTYKIISQAAALPPISPADHPFFASAGQDGFFTDNNQKLDRASDNVYSFQQQ